MADQTARRPAPLDNQFALGAPRRADAGALRGGVVRRGDARRQHQGRQLPFRRHP